MMHADIRHDWTVDEALELLEAPLLDLLYRAQAVHRAHNGDNRIQLASLLSIKTGGCPEDCKYCPQSAHYDVALEREPLAEVERVLTAARAARGRGATRFCMGAAWREARRGPEFDAVLEMVRGVRALGLEACVTLGMLSQDQADRLADAGLSAYNHNIDTGPDYYDRIITTRAFADRLATLEKVRRAGITLCTGGIIGMGESWRDRAHMLQVLSTLKPHPESVPINALVAVPGTPLADRPEVDPLELVRMCAGARIMMPRAKVRLSAGRSKLGREAQILCFLAGANSIFFGERLLTTANSACDEDLALLEAIGAAPLPPDTAATPETTRRDQEPQSAAG
jgi:biotin synthase